MGTSVRSVASVLGSAAVVTAACATAPSTPPEPVTRPSPTVVVSKVSDGAPEPRFPMNVKRPVVDRYHGEEVVDPYRWLEEGDSADVRSWTDAQNAKTRGYLDGDLRARLRGRLDELLTIGFVSSPAVRGGKGKVPRRWFHVRRDGKQDQPVVLVREALAGEDRVLLDPKTFAADPTSALDWWYPSFDGSKVAYGFSVSGNEQSTLRVRDVATGQDLADEIPFTRMSSVAWLPDGSGFFYSREPEPGTVPKDEEHYHRKVYEHRLGRHWRSDPLVWPAAGDARWKMTDIPSVDVSPSGKWLAVRIHHGWERSSVLLLDRAKGAWTTLVTGVDATFDPAFHRVGSADVLLVKTNESAPKGKLLRVDPAKPERESWKEIVPEGPDVLRSFDAVGKTLFVSFLHRASSRLERRTLEGALVSSIDLPVLGSAGVPSGDLDGDEALFEFQSYAYPPAIFRIDLKAKQPTPTVFTKIEAPLDPKAIAVDQIEATSKDGTKVTAFVVHRKDLAKDASAPGILYGYGGFNIPQTPSFNRSLWAFLERGGVYCVANLRGGGEYGEAWHRAGMLGNKQNVFDDAIAVAETLVEGKWVAKERLAALGGSNGGLLVGALVTQRPDLFRAAVSAVPLLDMLRYQNFLIAKLWIPEYGSSDDPVAYKWLKAYSPYHRVVDGTAYPAVLFMTAESDSRVDPLHARKMAARLQEATGSAFPVLLRVETKAGHGAGKPRSKQLEELADEYTFLFRELGVSF